MDDERQDDDREGELSVNWIDDKCAEESECKAAVELHWKPTKCQTYVRRKEMKQFIL